MIFYNMRYRGPFEYEKFLLNTLQYSNIINEYNEDINNTSALTSLNNTVKEVNMLFDRVVGDNGLNEEIYKKLIMFNSK